MNGVTGGGWAIASVWVRSLPAIRDEGGIPLPHGECITAEPIMVGRNADKLAALAAEHGGAKFRDESRRGTGRWLGPDLLLFDAQVRSERKKSILSAIGAGKHIYTEKPIAHWNYVLESLFGRVRAVTAKAVTHIPERWDEPSLIPFAHV